MALKNLVPWRKEKAPQPTDPFDALRQEMGSLFDRFHEGRELGPWPSATFSPAVDVKETKDAIEVTAELPGIEESELDLSLHDDRLTIKGEKRDESEKDEEGHKYVERSYGMFERTVPLPSGIDRDKVSASFDKGVLKVHMPKTAEAVKSTRKISISS